MGPGRAAAAPELNLHRQIRAAAGRDHGLNPSRPPLSGGVGSTNVDGWRTRQGQGQFSFGALCDPDSAPYASRMPSSRNCRSSTGDGAPVIRSEAVEVLGNAITSRIDSLPDKR